MTARRFAEDTKVSVGSSQGEIKDRLKAAGASRIAVFEEPEGSSVAFEIEARQYRISVPLPTGKNAQQEERRAWRLMLLLIKAKTEAIREGATTVEREFLADMLMPNGRTLHETAAESIRIAYESGKMPKSLMLTGPTP
jgi:hypothetical protein